MTQFHKNILNSGIKLFENYLNIDSDIFFSLYNKVIQEITQSRFGKNIQLYAPLYLSNECQNICTYCGFSLDNKLKRKTLTDAEILQEAAVLKSHGFDSILLVTGEDYRVNTDYILNAIQLLKPVFAQISIEVQPLETADYIRLKNSGVYGVFIYQETYNRDSYKQVHPKGKKSNFEYRLHTPERIGDAGIHKIGLGVLLGLTEDWRADATALAEHLSALQKKYWKSKFSISFPRIRPHEGEFQPKCHLSEKELLQLIAAFRITFPDVELTLSTRERATFRDIALQYGITALSAGSKTEPGGYSNSEALKQFEIDDERSAEEMASVIRKYGYEPVWKDWDMLLV